jgi:hypothetical protein
MDGHLILATQLEHLGRVDSAGMQNHVHSHLQEVEQKRTHLLLLLLLLLMKTMMMMMMMLVCVVLALGHPAPATPLRLRAFWASCQAAMGGWLANWPMLAASQPFCWLLDGRAMRRESQS